MQAFAVGTMTVGPAAGALAFDKRAGQHFAEGTEAADAGRVRVVISYDTNNSVRKA
jgi:hypothetical protein